MGLLCFNLIIAIFHLYQENLATKTAFTMLIYVFPLIHFFNSLERTISMFNTHVIADLTDLMTAEFQFPNNYFYLRKYPGTYRRRVIPSRLIVLITMKLFNVLDVVYKC